jgi:hypothetical protein
MTTPTPSCPDHTSCDYAAVRAFADAAESLLRHSWPDAELGVSESDGEESPVHFPILYVPGERERGQAAMAYLASLGVAFGGEDYEPHGLAVDIHAWPEAPLIVGIDPGPRESACALLWGGAVRVSKQPNEELLAWLRSVTPALSWRLGIEQVVSRPVHAKQQIDIRKDLIDTIFWTGRFAEAWGGPFERIPKSVCNTFLTNNTVATDAQVRGALIDHFGGKRVAVGSVRCAKCAGARRTPGRVECGECSASGFVSGARGPKKCPRCHGRGTVPAYVTCDPCAGSGWECPPGPLSGIVGADCWDALAVSVTLRDRRSA